MFWDSSDGIEENTITVTGFINKWIDIPTVTVYVPTIHKKSRYVL